MGVAIACLWFPRCCWEVLFFVAMLAGFIDSIAGGGGLLTIPASMAAGRLLLTRWKPNKLQACGWSIS
ncbi:hypothetical protein ACNKHM_21795 [Shigella sonnei]